MRQALVRKCPAFHAPTTSARHLRQLQYAHSPSPLHVRLRCTASEPQLITDWEQRRKDKVLVEVLEAAKKKGLSISPDTITNGFQLLESLVPGFSPNLDTMKATDWAQLAGDISAVAQKVILLKTHYPRLDLAPVLAVKPQLLMQSLEQLEKSAIQVKSLLQDAKDTEALLQAIPSLMDPKTCISVLVTVRKWYNLKREPIEVLEKDPDLVRRAQENDVPFDPVYVDEDGNWTAPLLNYKEKRTDWQAYIDQKFYKQP